ncbi:MAG: hypothetical protein V2I57_07255 [Xanthomonadales bacterium]|nr:hypothetical protein [Xanthomonadales bacterium]
MTTLARIVVFGSAVLCASSLAAAPVGFSVNADAPDGDSLYAVDLADGSTSARGLVQSATGAFLDVEGLAFDANGTLWGVDEQSLSLFPISTGNGTVNLNEVQAITGLSATSGNDFGLTFACDGNLYLSAVADGTLYRLGLDGAATPIGALAENISALAAYGNPVRLVGLSNGLQSDGGPVDSRSLYDIDPATGALTLIGAVGPAVADYAQAGLSFDADGNLWALTDRRIQGQDLGSEVLSIDLATGQATVVATTPETGFESLAVAPPAGCTVAPPPPPQPPPTARPRSRVDGIPTLDFYGKLGAALALLLTGFLVLRQRP